MRPLEAGETYAVLVDEGGGQASPRSTWAAPRGPSPSPTWPGPASTTRRWGRPRRRGWATCSGPATSCSPAWSRGAQSPLDLARAGKPLPLSLEQVPRVEGALVAIDPATRGVRALVGGQDFARSQFNRAIQAKRQPGSAFKPFVWGAAIESGRFTPATVVYDTPDLYRDPWTGKEWKPQNFEKDVYEGPMLLRDALAHSKNTVSAKLVDALGVEAVIDFARRCGIESELPRSLSLALGTGEVTPLELVNGYATLAAGGLPGPAHPRDPGARPATGNVLEETQPLRAPARSRGRTPSPALRRPSLGARRRPAGPRRPPPPPSAPDGGAPPGPGPRPRPPTSPWP